MEYRIIFPHVTVLDTISQYGQTTGRGDIIEYIYTNVEHQNPLNRVVTVGSGDNFGLNYDKEKYKEMLPDADETVLGVFGFFMESYCKPKDKKWWMELRRNRMNDVRAEIGT